MKLTDIKTISTAETTCEEFRRTERYLETLGNFYTYIPETITAYAVLTNNHIDNIIKITSVETDIATNSCKISFEYLQKD